MARHELAGKLRPPDSAEVGAHLEAVAQQRQKPLLTGSAVGAGDDVVDDIAGPVLELREARRASGGTHLLSAPELPRSHCQLRADLLVLLLRAGHQGIRRQELEGPVDARPAAGKRNPYWDPYAE
eukprot:14708201-Alexandrium_andersonii.AAC.1